MFLGILMTYVREPSEAMVEKHELEQYFWTPETIHHIADYAVGYDQICCLCAPTVGAELGKRGHRVTNLDIDNRFAETPGFQLYDLYRPKRIEENFDLILCDPPFYNVSLSQLFSALRIIANYRMDMPLMIGYLKRRERSVLGTFAPFGLCPTGYNPEYVTVQPSERNQIEIYSNMTEEECQRLQNPLANS